MNLMRIIGCILYLFSHKMERTNACSGVSFCKESERVGNDIKKKSPLFAAGFSVLYLTILISLEFYEETGTSFESVEIGNRYMDITQMFDSIRDDSKRLIAQLDDGKISGTEKVSNWWMKIRRGTPSDRGRTRPGDEHQPSGREPRWLQSDR